MLVAHWLLCELLALTIFSARSPMVKEKMNSSGQCIRFAAVGDILLMPAADRGEYRRSAKLVSDEIGAIFEQSDLVFGNLECTLACDDQRIPTEPRVITDDNAVRSVKAAGFDVVSLANNHMFDALAGGFQKLQRMLGELSLSSFGAGLDLAEATAPAIVDCKGVRVAFLGAVDERSGPFRFASALLDPKVMRSHQTHSCQTWGVAPLSIDCLRGQIRELRSQVHHVIVSVHWGEERFGIPSPVQVQQARELVDAGASMVLGHHPHVLQGLEVHHGAPIIYSLGNFVADEVYFSNDDAIRWSRLERTGSILLTELSSDSVRVIQQIPTFDDGELVSLDHSGYGERRIRRTSQALAGGVSSRRYRREHVWIKTIRPTLDHLRPSQIRHLRVRHFRSAWKMLLRSRAAQ